MFRYTRASLNILVDDVKKCAFIFGWIAMIFTLCYCSYQVLWKFFVENEISILYIVLLSAFSIFTILDIIFSKTKAKVAKKIVKRMYKWTKLGSKVFTLGASLFEIYNAGPGGVDGITLILTTLLIILWVLSFGLEILVEVVTDRTEILYIAFKQDVDDIKRPFTTASNVVKKITGQKIEESKRDRKKERVLDNLDEYIFKNNIKQDEEDE